MFETKVMNWDKTEAPWLADCGAHTKSWCWVALQWPLLNTHYVHTHRHACTRNA